MKTKSFTTTIAILMAISLIAGCSSTKDTTAYESKKMELQAAYGADMSKWDAVVLKELENAK